MTSPTLRPDWLPHEEYPFEVRRLELPAGSVSYVDEGSGPTLLFVHAGMWSFVWRDVMMELEDEFRTIAIDFPGFGLSPDTSGDPTIAGLSAVLADFVAHLDLNQVTLVAHDLGGPVGLGALAADPERYEAIVLTNTFAWEPEQRSLRAMLRTMGSGALERFDIRTALLPKMTASRFGVGRNLTAAGKQAFLGPFRDPARIRRLHRLMASAISSPDHMALVEATAKGAANALPVLTIFGGRNDPWKFQRRHEDTFPNHEGHILSKRYHFPMGEDPDRFGSLIREWSRQLTSA
jgi:pimeloyl-ACP methyl ester carboxylesterase